jgi:hypothetical protein
LCSVSVEGGITAEGSKPALPALSFHTLEDLYAENDLQGCHSSDWLWVLEQTS